MRNSSQLTALYLDVFTNTLGLPATDRPDGSIGVTLDNGLLVVARHFAPKDPEYLHLTAAFVIDEAGRSLAETVTGVNLKTKGAKINRCRTSDCWICGVKLLVARPGWSPTKQHLSVILPRSFRMIERALQNLHGDLGLSEPADLSGQSDFNRTCPED